MIVEAGQKKRWEPKDPERFLSDETARDSSLSAGVRFAWDRAWQPERRKKGYVAPKPVEAAAPVQTEEEAWADEAAEITAQAAEQSQEAEAGGEGHAGAERAADEQLHEPAAQGTHDGHDGDGDSHDADEPLAEEKA